MTLAPRPAPRNLLLLAAGLLLAPASGTAQAGADFDQDVRALLAYTELEAIAEQLGAGLAEQVLALAPALPEERSASVRDVIRDEISPAAMGDDVVAFLAEAGDPVMVAELLEWLPTGATAELAAISDAYEPSLTLEEYAAQLESDLPSEARIVAVAGWAQTQQAALFYLAVQEAQTAAAHSIAAALDGAAPPYQPPQQAEVGQTLEAYFGLAVVTFLWSLEPAPDELITRATEEYSSPSGQWFVESYSAAVVEAIERGARRVVARVGD